MVYLHTCTYQFILSPSPVNPGLGVVGVQLKESVEVLSGSSPHPVEKLYINVWMLGYNIICGNFCHEKTFAFSHWRNLIISVLC